MTDRLPRFAAPLVALLAVASSIIGIVNKFTYDDRQIVELNPVMRDHTWARLFVSPYWPKYWGGDGYRPITMFAFKTEYTIGHGSPIAFHAANILLLALASVLVFFLARRLLPEWAAWITAALFAVHPVHVEAVANVVGQSELLVACALLAATDLYLRDRLRGPLQLGTAAKIFGLYAFACFAKEHGIVLPGLLAAAELFVIPDDAPWSERIRRLRPVYLTLVLIAVLFVAARSQVLADHSLGGFQPFTPFSALRISTRDRILTAISVVPQWLRLLYWPVHLSSEYGPPELPIAQGWSIVQVPGLLVLAAVLALVWVLRKRQPVISFGIAFVCVVLLPSSNFVLPAGIMLAERTLFLPSVGAMLVAGAVAVAISNWARARYGERPASRSLGYVFVGLVLVAGMARSLLRTPVWYDNDRLFNQAVIDSPLAYRAHYMLGAWSFEKKRKREGEAEYRKALNLFPYDPFLSYNMAEQYRVTGLCGPALPLYRWTHDLDPAFPLGHGALAWCLLNEGFYSEARARALDAIRVGADLKLMRSVIAIADTVLKRDSVTKLRADRTNAVARGKVPDFVQKTAAATNVHSKG